MPKTIRTETEAMGYVGAAIMYKYGPDVDLNAVFDISELPGLLEAYDKVDTLSQEEADFVTETFMKRYTAYMASRN